jgi:hypothetical protein
MFGLDDGQGEVSVLSRSLAGYVQDVADAIGVPSDAVGYEVSDTATAYLGLAGRVPEHANRDLMLVWDERLGWYVGVATHPGETPVVLCHLEGEAVPLPAVVARFVAEAIAGKRAGRLRSVPPQAARLTLARRMAASRPSR